MKYTSSLLLAAGLTLTSTSKAALLINEFMFNPPGTDNGNEYFELIETSGVSRSLADYSLIYIDGDNSVEGRIKAAFNLGAYNTGSNGLLLWRDSTAILQPEASSATTLVTIDFSPDIENGSNTIVLARGFTGAVGDDLDTNNDGTLDTLPWNSVSDAIGITENDAGNNFSYAGQLGGFSFGVLVFTPDIIMRVGENRAWLASDLNGTSPGPFEIDPLELELGPGASAPSGAFFATPGSHNVSSVPEPTTVGLSTLGLVAILRRRRK